MIRGGLVSVTFRALSAGEIVDLVARAGLTGIEWGGDVHVPHGDVACAREVYQRTVDAGLTVCSYGSYYRVGSGEPPAFEAVIESALAAAILEEAIALGCRNLIACGSAGVLDRSIAVGHLLVPISAVRDEGTSYHYLPPGREAEPTPEAVAAIEAGNAAAIGKVATDQAEAGADYIAFGPVSGAGLGDGTVAERDLFAWWSEMIEIPVVAEGGLDVSRIAQLTPYTDFFGIGEEIWSTDEPVTRLGELIEAVG